MEWMVQTFKKWTSHFAFRKLPDWVYLDDLPRFAGHTSTISHVVNACVFHLFALNSVFHRSTLQHFIKIHGRVKIHQPWETTKNSKSRTLRAPFFCCLLPLNSRLDVLMADTCTSTSVTIEVEAVDTWNNWERWGEFGRFRGESPFVTFLNLSSWERPKRIPHF